MNASYWTDTPPVKTLMSNFSVNFICDSVGEKTKEEIARKHGAVYNEDKKRWEPYFDSAKDAKLLGASTKVLELDAANGSGFYLIQDDRDGDPAQRERYLSFCIFHNTKAVCGSEPVTYLSDPHGDLLPYILDILHSVEFVDASGSVPVPASVPVRQ